MTRTEDNITAYFRTYLFDMPAKEAFSPSLSCPVIGAQPNGHAEPVTRARRWAAFTRLRSNRPVAIGRACGLSGARASALVHGWVRNSRGHPPSKLSPDQATGRPGSASKNGEVSMGTRRGARGEARR